jgi:hypothetical protein
MGEVIQLQGDQRKDVQEFLVAKDGLELDAKTIKVSISFFSRSSSTDNVGLGSWFLNAAADILCYPARTSRTDRSCRACEKPFLERYFFPLRADLLLAGQLGLLTIAFDGWDRVVRVYDTHDRHLLWDDGMRSEIHGQPGMLMVYGIREGWTWSQLVKRRGGLFSH